MSNTKENPRKYVIGFIVLGGISFWSIHYSMLWASGVAFCCSALCLKSAISILFESKKKKKKEYNGKRKNSKKLLEEIKKKINKKDK